MKIPNAGSHDRRGYGGSGKGSWSTVGRRNADGIVRIQAETALFWSDRVLAASMVESSQSQRLDTFLVIQHEQSLPPPPPGKEGWPWYADFAQTEVSSLLPKISIVTPCLNSAEKIEECIRSVLLQGYPNLEYVVIDGGSTDQTTEIIRKYEEFLTYWVSEKDSGQSAAINKGVAKCSGVLVNWLNADDILLPGALLKIGQACEPGSHQQELVLCPVRNVNIDTGKRSITGQDLLLGDVVRYWSRQSSYHQPGIFLPLEVWNQVGGLDETLEICMDYDLYCKCAPYLSCRLLDFVVVEFRQHKNQKSAVRWDLMLTEKVRASKRYWQRENVSNAEKVAHDAWIARCIAFEVGLRHLGFVASLLMIVKLSVETGLSPMQSISHFVRPIRRFWHR